MKHTRRRFERATHWPQPTSATKSAKCDGPSFTKFALIDSPISLLTPASVVAFSHHVVAARSL